MERPHLSAMVALLLFAGGLLVLPGAQSHPHHLLEANETLDNPRGVDTERWVAQSFVLNGTYEVTRVELYVVDIGGGSHDEALTVALQGDATGFPDGADVAAASVNGPGTADWLAFDLGPATLQGGVPYWIVARSDANKDKGYDWWHSGGDTYGTGRAVESKDGGASWANLSQDQSFRVYGYQQPSMTFDATVNDTAVLVGDPLVFRVDFANEGDGTAAKVWVNVTLPSELAYLSDDADAIGGVRTGTSYEFTEVAPGNYTFNLTAEAVGGTANGTVTTTHIAFESTDHNGAPDVQTGMDLEVTVLNAQLEAALALRPTDAVPGDVVDLEVNVSNGGVGSASGIAVQATVDANATYLSSSPEATYDPGLRTLTWSLGDLAPGASVLLTWRLEVPPGSPDGTRVTTLVDAAYDDPTGTAMPSVQVEGEAAVHAPVFDPVLTLSDLEAERGDEVTATLHYNNSGSASAGRAWANWSLGGHYELVETIKEVSVTGTSDGFSVALTDVAPGTHALAVRLRVLRGMDDGLAMGLTVTWSATDGGGNLTAPLTRSASVGLQAPAVTLALEGPSGPVPPDRLFALNLTARNGGSAPATGWLLLSLPTGVEYVGDNVTLLVETSANEVRWRVVALPGGASLSIRAEMRRVEGTEPVALRLAMNVTDGRGSPEETVLSNTVAVEFQAEGGPVLDGFPWPLLLPLVGAAAGVPAALWYVQRRRPAIEEVFVVHQNGVLLAHRSKTLTPDKDKDVLASMLKAVQDFVRHSFAEHEDAPVRSLEFGEYRILIENQPDYYVAVVFRGVDDGSVAKGLERLTRRVHAAYGDVLADWDGDMRAVQGLNKLLPTLWEARTEAPAEGALSQTR